ncbi:L-histidine N(alpha)-methyltransferase [Sulfitobacter sp. S190]|nr:L-histidine N(alpha)-methyltransferase [Sulfitobacter sp. S190]
MREDALRGLSAPQKVLSPKWLYDARGSALFERITTLPEYYPTRTEAGILRAHAPYLAGLVPPGGALAELGSGASVKTRTLLDAGAHFGAYVPIDISRDFLFETADDLRLRYPALGIMPVVADFTGPVALPPGVAGKQVVGFFPGSTIGNLPPALARDLLLHARAWPDVGHFILGADLVKDPETLIAAYDDTQGVTAQFIGNLLVRLNDELGADFDVNAFDYEATWNALAARIDMHLVSTRDQTAQMSGQTFEFERDERIHVSAARKYSPDSIEKLAHEAGWKLNRMLTDADEAFAVCVLEAAESIRA